jgi:Protein of unknown function (DUF3300)
MLLLGRTLLGKASALALVISAALACMPSGAFAENTTAPAGNATTPAAAQPAGSPGALQPASLSTFSRDELKKLLAPYALYPDALLAQVLPASAYVVDIVQASRWLSKNKDAVAKRDFSALDQLNLDPTVKALARFPGVIQLMNTDLDATSDLGDAFVNQPSDVASVVQELRQAAQSAGSLKTTDQQQVRTETQNGRNYIVIEPTEPGVVYAPTYDAETAYAPGAALLGFGLGVAVGVGIGNYWNWNNGGVYPPAWPGYGGGYGRYPSQLPSNINIGNDINIGGGTRPWRPDSGRYRPGQGTKPGLGNPGAGIGNRPGGIGNGPGGGLGNRPQIGGGPAGNPGRGGLAGSGRPKASTRPAGAGKRPAQNRAARPTAFGDARMGGGSNFTSQRGMSSRSSPIHSRGGGYGGGFGGGRSFGGGGYGGRGFGGGGFGGGGRSFGGGGRGGGGRRMGGGGRRGR